MKNKVTSQDLSEIMCGQIFIESYNKYYGTAFGKPIKNGVQDEIDLFSHDNSSGKSIRIQVKKADPIFAGDFGKSLKKFVVGQRELLTRNDKQFQGRILRNINVVENKYVKQKKDMSNVYLLLDEFTNPPEIVVNQIKLQIIASTFKEIWLVTRCGVSYQLYRK